MTVLLGFAALVVDVGLNWAARTSAQTAADSAALAGAARLLADGPALALETVATYLDENVDGLADPTNLVWATNIDESDGEVVCWTLPDPPPTPAPGGLANCPQGSNALQVITPPIEVAYAFAGVFGERSNEIKASAAAGAGPGAPNNCVLCLLDPGAPVGLTALLGGVEVTGGGIAVNSEDLDGALVLTGDDDVSAEQIRVVGGVDDPPGGAQLIPAPEEGGPPVADPLAGLRTPDQLVSPPALVAPPLRNFATSTDATLQPGVYDSIAVSGNAELTLEEGVYVIRGFGLTVTDDAQLVSSGDGVTIYLACSGYPVPCSGQGARFRLLGSGRFLADPPATGEYAGLSIFADRGNTQTVNLRSRVPLDLTGALYGPRTPLLVNLTSGGLRVESLLVAGSLQVASPASVEVSYDPTVLLPGAAGPVLIR